MTPRQIRLVQRSFALIEPRADKIGISFYEKLFELAPEVRPLFKNDIDLQQRKLMNFFAEYVKLQLRSLLTLPITAASDPEVSIPGVVGLAKRHVSYGARPEHFVATKQALFWSFEQNLGDHLDEETRMAWSAAFDMIAASMIRVMRAEAKEPVLPEARSEDEAWEQAPQPDADSMDAFFQR